MWLGSVPEGTLLSLVLLIFSKSLEVAAQLYKEFPLLINSPALRRQEHIDFAK